MTQPFLSFDIVRRLPGFTLQCRVNFDAGVTAVFGPSGSGKTTLLDCIAGLAAPSEGWIEVRGTTVYSSSPRRNVPPEKRRIGYVFQDSALFPHMSVRENILYGYRPADRPSGGIDPDHLIGLFGLGPLLDRGVANLSGGERARVALARALCPSPSLLLLDEPLASLDLGFRGVIIRYLKRIWRELQTPMVYVSHSISEVMALAESAVVLVNGRVVAQGEPSALLFHPTVSPIANYATLTNLVEATVVSTAPDGAHSVLRVGDARLVAPEVRRASGEVVTVSIRANDILVAVQSPTGISARNILAATVEEVHALGPRVLVYASVGTRLVAEITSAAMEELDIRPGQTVYLILKSVSIMVLDTLGDASGG